MRCITRSIVILIALFSTISHSSGSTVLDDRLISAIEIQGLQRVKEQFVLNNIRTTVGSPFNQTVVSDDVRRLNRLGRFKPIVSKVILQSDGTVHVVFVLTEQQIIVSVYVTGNKAASDRDLISLVPMLPGIARDTFLIDRGRRAISERYRKLGYYQVEVEVDEAQLDNAGVLIYNIMEGPRVRVKSVHFEGNKAFTDKQLSAEIETSIAVPFVRRGELDEYIVDADVATLVQFYHDRGYLETRVDQTIQLSADNESAKVTFLIVEGEGSQYTVGKILTQTIYGQPLIYFSSEQIAALIPIKRGDVFNITEIHNAEKVIIDAYGALGHIDMRVQTYRIYTEQESVADLLFEVSEGEYAKVGLVKIMNNYLTKDEVIRGRLKLTPGRLFDGAETDRARDRLRKTRIFNDVKVKIQPEDPNNPGIRDVVIEVKEMQTGSVNFGLMAGSDDGVMGTISLNQRNFDLADLPATWSEFWQGKAFRGAGQGFSMAFQPGDEVFNYQVSLNEPRFLQTDYSVGGNVGYTRRVYNDYNEEKFYSKAYVGRKFGDIWSGRVSLIANRVEITDIDNDVPLEIFNDRGPASVDAIRLAATRTTLKAAGGPRDDQRIVKGSRLELGISQYGIFSSDYTFTKSMVNYTKYFTVDKDFIGRRTTLRLDGKVGYIFGGDAPTFESYYLGGRSFRGFDFRTVSPKGTPRFVGGSTDVPIGGDWKIFLGAQYEMPVAGKFLSTVFFVDSGTVTDSPGFDEYRVSVGMGLRLYIPQLGSVPLAFDFGFPVIKQESDVKKVFSFSIQMPF